MTRDAVSTRDHNDNAQLTATLTIDALESRMLLSATWTDGDTDNPMDGPTVHNDILTGSSGRDLAHALDGDDLMMGQQGHDQLFGDGGDDGLFGGMGNDKLFGGDGNDVLDGGEGHDRLEGGNDADHLSGGDGNDYLTGDTGNDTLLGDAGHDRLLGDAGHDSLVGGDGNDRLDGGAGNDVLDGGAGNDTLQGGTGMDQLHGGADNDRLYGGDDNDVLDGGGGNDRLYGDAGDDALRGDDGNDYLYGGDRNDVLEGGAGNDRLYGEAGDDALRGDDGSDYLYGGHGSDQLSGGDGNDRLYGGDDSDRLDGGLGDDRLDGGHGDDLLLGGDGNDQLLGADGADSLFGGAGNDRMDGGNHDDRLSGGEGNDVLYGRDGIDELSGGAGNDRLYGGNDADQLTGGLGDDYLDGGHGDDSLWAGDGTDRLYAGDGNDLLDGGLGTDRLDGGAGDDFAHGGDGNDTLLGRDGVDQLYGDSGDDTLSGGNDGDHLDGGEGNDRLDGGSGDDVLLGGDGDDRLTGGDGNDQLDGGVGDNVLYGQNGDDTIISGAGNDRIDGGSGDDVIHAGAGNNRVSSGQGNDIIHSGDGDDTINAGAGNDTIHYYGGNDRIHVGSGDDTVVVHEGHHGDVLVINGGGKGDVLDLSAYRTDQVTIEGSKITVDLRDGGSFVINARGFEEIITTDVPPLTAYAGADIDVKEGVDVALHATATSNAPLDFLSVKIESYGGSQDATAVANVEGDGEILHIQGNGWKAIDFPYAVTENTILEFEFRSDAEGEIHGIGFDNDNNLSPETTFKLFGTQAWGNSDFDRYESADGWAHYRIRVGDYFTGEFGQLVFANDHDVAHATGESLFRNLRVYEHDSAADAGLSYSWQQLSGPEITLTGADSAVPTFVAPGVDHDTELVFQVTVTDGFTVSTDTVAVRIDEVPKPQWTVDAGLDAEVMEGGTLTLDVAYTSALKFDASDVESYGGLQDANVTVQVEDAGTTLHLQGNGWKQIDLPYTVTKDTVLEFDFRSTAEGEIHGIGFDSDNDISADTTFKLHGTQAWGRIDFDNYDGEVGEWQHYRIRAGDFFTGDFDHLVFVNDHDVSHPTGESLFSNIRVYEDTPAAQPDIHWAQISGPEVDLTDAHTGSPHFATPAVDENTELVFQVTLGTGDQIVTDTVTVMVVNNPMNDALPPGDTPDPVVPSQASPVQAVADLQSHDARPSGREFEWADEAFDELAGQSDFGFGEPLQALDQALELVHMGLDDGGHAIAGIPVLRDVLHLGDRHENVPLVDQPLPGNLSDLRHVHDHQGMENRAGDLSSSAEIRHPVLPAQGDQVGHGLRAAESDSEPAPRATSGFAALWGLVRGFAGTRVHHGKDNV